MTDESHQHEALHACYISEDMFERHVVNSDFVNGNADLFKLANEAISAIATLYQAIGAKDVGE